MTWNYRVVEREAGTIHDSIGIYEVSYEEDESTPRSIAENPTTLCVDGTGTGEPGGGVLELWKTYELMRKAFNKKMLCYEAI